MAATSLPVRRRWPEPAGGWPGGRRLDQEIDQGRHLGRVICLP